MFSLVGPTRQFNQNFLTFNSLNTYILKGDGAQGMQFTFATLMQVGGDEPIGGTATWPAACAFPPTSVTHVSRCVRRLASTTARKLTAHDVAFSLNILKEKGHPIIKQLTRDLAGAEALGR